MNHSIRAAGRVSGPLAFFADNLAVGACWRAGAAWGAAQACFAVVLIGLGVLGLVHGDFAGVWQAVPFDRLPGRTVLAYGCAVLELAIGVGLLFRSTRALASRALFVFLVLWVMLLKFPGLAAATWRGFAGHGFLSMAGACSAFGEIAIILAGGWTVSAFHAGPWGGAGLGWATGARGVRHARLLALALPMIGFSNVVYAQATADFMPAWIPWHLFWACLTGAESIAAGLGILFGIFPRLAVALEAASLVITTLIVWGPMVAEAPWNRTPWTGSLVAPVIAVYSRGAVFATFAWTGFLISSAIAVGVWLVAGSYRGVPWFAVGRGHARRGWRRGPLGLTIKRTG